MRKQIRSLKKNSRIRWCREKMKRSLYRAHRQSSLLSRKSMRKVSRFKVSRGILSIRYLTERLPLQNIRVRAEM